MAKVRHVAIAVECVVCGAHPGDPCTSRRNPNKKITPHPERHEDYAKLKGKLTSRRSKKPKVVKPITYKTYMKSAAWQAKRKLRLSMPDSFECWVCGNMNFVGGKHVHHRTYDRLGRENMNDLVVTCADCNMKKIPKLVKFLKDNHVIDTDFQWIATDYLRRTQRLASPVGQGSKLTEEQYQSIKYALG